VLPKLYVNKLTTCPISISVLQIEKKFNRNDWEEVHTFIEVVEIFVFIVHIKQVFTSEMGKLLSRQGADCLVIKGI
tara:strand:- start:5324 stop:5551 length:228 start_codon:yes stop_codon:yes gene_type:complete